MKLKKYTLRDNVVSALIGVVIATPLCMYAYHNQTKEITPEPSRTVYVEKPTEEITTLQEVATIQEVTTEEITTEALKIPLGNYIVTAYCPCEECCPGTSDGITYTETVATEGRTVSVDPEVIPLGSVVEVNGVEYVAEDIGGAIKGDRIEIFFNSHEDALEWGVQSHDVYMIQD